MFRQRIPLWVTLGGLALTVAAGWINAVGFMSVRQQAISHMSGTATMMAIDFAQPAGYVTGRPAKVLLSFFLGAVVSGCIIRNNTLRLGRRYGVALGIESVLLFAATFSLRGGEELGYCLAAAACGLQNAMASSYSGSVIRTTHLTGMITDLGVACGHLLLRLPVEWRRFQLYGVLLLGFVIGSYLGALAYSRYNYEALLFPAVLSGISGLVYTAFKQWEKYQHPPHA